METRFWQDAYSSLPAGSRRRYAFHLKSAERWELRLDTVIELWTRVSAGLAKAFHTPRPTHP
jgi:hypothetical protein